MALTAWGTYVEDRVDEAVKARFGSDAGHATKFMLAKLEEELKKFHNPTSDRTRKLFDDYLGIDVVSGWTWQHMDPEKARKELDGYLKKRGDAVHRSRPLQASQPAPHLVTKGKLEKAIRFIKDLVAATERSLNGG